MQAPPVVPADSLARVLDGVFGTAPYRWVEPHNPLAWLGRWWDALVAWLGRFRAENPAAFDVFVWTLIGLLVLLLGHTVWVIVRTVRRGVAHKDPGHVKLEVQRGAASYRAEADQLALTGRYREAMRAAFIALMLDLDQRGVLRFQPSKTAYEYTAEPSLSDAARTRLRGLVGQLYRYNFAGSPCDAAAYASWRAQADVEQYAPAH